jgi:AraC-like DNA-binding protein
MHKTPDYACRWSIPLVEGVEAFRAHFTHFFYARHSHDSYAVGTIDAGAMRFWHGGAVHIATAGTVIAINPSEVHDECSGSPQGCSYRMLYVECNAIGRLCDSDTPRRRHAVALRGPVQTDAQLAHALRRCYDTLASPSADPPLALEQQSRLLQIVSLLFARYGTSRLETSNAVAGNHYGARAKEYMAAHLSERIYLMDMAHMVGLSPFYLLRAFKRATGMPPPSYLYQLRLDHARVLLRRGVTPVQVAAELGFTDQSHLTRRFKAAFGVTPGQYASTP